MRAAAMGTAPVGTEREPSAPEPFDRLLARLLAGLGAVPATPARDGAAGESGPPPVLVGPHGSLDGPGFRASVAGLAAALRARGAGPGAAVGILVGADRPEGLTARHAAHRLGAPVVHLRSANARSDRAVMAASAQEHVLRTAGVRVLVTDEGARERAHALRAVVPDLRTVDVDTTDATVTGDPGAAHVWRADETAVIDLTSGTTGTPRLVPHSAAARTALVSHSAGTAARGYRPVLLAVTPVSHTISAMADGILLDGGTVVLAPDAGPEEIVDAVARHGVTDTYLPTPTLYRLVEHLGAHPDPLAGLRRVTYSGTVAAPARIAEARCVLGDRVAQLYGSTEAGGITSLVPLDHDEPLLRGSVGRPFPWVDVRIEAHGEVGVRSATVMQGYLGGTDSGLTADGWLRTGDLGHLDEYGYLHLTGRVGEVVKAHGIKIYPSAVVRALSEHPAVADAVVFGVRDDDRREHLHAAVEPREGHVCDVEDLADHVATRLTPEHVPSRFALWAPLPRTASGKPDVSLLREQEVIA